ncbi:N-sulfoglucosamine sulfohydrolase [Arthrobacter sp. 31Cvi3.1E]|nr:N-sulfoglucosamine sulfohydrolase [Arthrobacter sp. 31Cvi3.1E]
MTNILLITADDMDGNTPGSFGGPSTATPALDALAASGMTFHRGHVPAAVCQPSRSALMTGLWPHKNGAEGFEPINQGIAVINDLLKSAGYLVGILGKVGHLQPVERFGWDTAVDMKQLGLGRSPEAYGAMAAAFMQEANAEGRPWFLMANAHDPHRPFHGSEDERQRWTDEERREYPEPSKVFSPEEVTVPDFLPDIPGVRTEYAQYLSSARRCDDVVASVLEAVDSAGATDETLVVFLSDNGMAFPFAKANCYLRSTLTPLIVRWPKVTTPGSRNEESFVNMIDLFPTFCDAAGVKTPAGLDGRSIKPLLEGESEDGRLRVFTVFHETAAKRRFEMRCVQDDAYGYIWNEWAGGGVRYGAENMRGLSWPAMAAASENDETLRARTDFYLHRSREELYDLAADPACLVNLASEPDMAAVISSRRAAMAEWMEANQDPLAASFLSQVGAEESSPSAPVR